MYTAEEILAAIPPVGATLPEIVERVGKGRLEIEQYMYVLLTYRRLRLEDGIYYIESNSAKPEKVA